LTEKTKPPTYEELVALTGDLAAEVQRQQSTIGTLQATVIAKDAELARALRPNIPLIEMDPKADDKFRRRY
jgi:hypothetical protein